MRVGWMIFLLVLLPGLPGMVPGADRWVRAAAGAVRPERTPGGRRRYSRRQLAFAARIRELLDQGRTLAAAQRILALEDDVAAERALSARLHERLGEQGGNS
jgi:MerR family transcriptional regulator, heat shock protein HspR